MTGRCANHQFERTARTSTGPAGLSGHTLAPCRACAPGRIPARAPGRAPGRVPATGRFRPSWVHPFRRAPRLVQDLVAVSPVIGTVMILAISIIGITAVLTWGLPNIQQTQAEAETQGVLQQFTVFDQVTEGVIRGGAIGKASEASLTVPIGQVTREPGTLFVVTRYLNQSDTNPARHAILDLDDNDPQHLRIVPESGSIAGLELEVERYEGDTPERPNVLTATPSPGPPATPVEWHVRMSGEETFWNDTTVLRIKETVNNDKVVRMESWLVPTGSLRYQRPGPLGEIALHLDSGAVILDLAGGSGMQTRPIATLEKDDNNDPRFFTFFTIRYVDNATYPGVQAGGAGSYPLLFALAGNHLRANGDKVVSIHVDAYGTHADLWKSYFKDRYGFVDGPTTGLYRDAARYPAPHDDKVKAITFVHMESRVELTLNVPTADLGSA